LNIPEVGIIIALTAHKKPEKNPWNDPVDDRRGKDSFQVTCKENKTSVEQTILYQLYQRRKLSNKGWLQSKKNVC
jgi:hypothetical protein